VLWLCVDLPELPLEAAFGIGEYRAACRVVSEGRRVCALSAPCHGQGIRIGQSLSTAQALCSGLVSRSRDPARERALLDLLADACLDLTPNVARLEPRALLLEVGGCLRLFGGLDALLERLETLLDERGHRYRVALAPTPEAAGLLVRSSLAGAWRRYWQPQAGRIDAAAFMACLGRLPVAALALDARRRRQLRDAGLKRLDDLLALPPAALGRRFGQDLLQRLERIRGSRPDPRPTIVPPARFRGSLSFDAALDDLAALRFPMHRLLDDLLLFLRRRQVWCQSLHWLLHCEGRVRQRLRVRCASPAHDAASLLALSMLQLERRQLPAAVLGLSLLCRDYAPLEAAGGDLFEPHGNRQAQHDRLLDRLRGRLGDDAVHGIACHPEHLPELAWRRCPPGAAPDAVPTARDRLRPLWLLERAERLQTDARRPLWRGRLELLSGPERISSRWWQGEATRDYFVARCEDGTLCWIYRHHGSGAWFLHGVFA
jgi:protein ImuB